MRKQAPDRAKDGSFLHQDSVPGKKLILVDGGSSLGNSITIPAGDFGSFTSSVSFLDRTTGNLIPYDQTIPFAFPTFYVDGYDEDHRFIIGPSSGSYKLSIGTYIIKAAADDDFTHMFVANLYNGGVGSHTVYMDLDWRLMQTLPVVT